MEQGIVCIIDALGTKGCWNAADPVSYLKNLECIHSKLEDAKKIVNPQTEFDYVTFSDTIILLFKYKEFHTPGNQPPFMLIPFFARIIDGVFSYCLGSGLFMRGAISCGDYLKRGNIIIGPAVDDAARLYEKQEMLGIVLTPHTTLLADSALELMRIYPYDGYNYTPHLIKYNTPLKGDIVEPLYQINWPYSAIKSWGSIEPKIDNITRLKSLLGIRPIPLEAYLKHKNTISFFEYSSKFNI